MPPKSTRARKAPNREPVSAIAPRPAPILVTLLSLDLIDPSLAYDSTTTIARDDTYDDYLPCPSPTSSNHSFSKVQVGLGPSVTLEGLTQSTPPFEHMVIPNDLQQPISTEQSTTKEQVFSWSFAMEEALFNELLHQDEAGKRADSGFKKEAWIAVVKEVSKHTTQVISIDQCKNKLDIMKHY